MAKSYVIGMDFGSDSVRAVLVDAENGREVKSAVCAYPRWAEGKYSDPSKYQFRHSPEDYLFCLQNVIRMVVNEFPEREKILAISVDTTASTPCAVDAELTPLSLLPAYKDNPDAMFILWKDHTAEKESREIESACRKAPYDYSCHSGSSYSPENYWSKVLHIIRNDAGVRRDAAAFVELCDWIPAVLTGCRDPKKIKSSHCVAAGKMMWSKKWGGYPPKEFFLDLEPALSRVHDNLPEENFGSYVAAGHLCPEWAEKVGLGENVLVGVGNVDSHSGGVGAGIAYRRMVMNFGTSACYMCVVPAAVISNQLVPGAFGQADGLILKDLDGFEIGLSAFGDDFAWLKRLLVWAGGDSENVLDRLAAEAALLEPRVDAPLATDHLNGRRSPMQNSSLRAGIVNLRLDSSPAELYYALVEATAFATKIILDHLAGYGIDFDSLVAVGGVAQKSAFVMQMISDVLGKKIDVSDYKHSGALGSAIHAAVLSGLYPDVPSAEKAMCPPDLRSFVPKRQGDPVLKARFERYKALVSFNEID
ncbi:MAG: ribulokinase [Bacteroidales bacterium]|nr:ribulokinase [Bacteroidales bacterium]